MLEIKYPAQVTGHTIHFTEDKAQVLVSGFEKITKTATDTSTIPVNLARIDFVPVKENDQPSFIAFINRVGFLQVTRPLWLLPSILVLLEQEGNIILDGNGNLSKTNKVPVAIT
ncbi:hypothetical protein [Cellulophaga baltica]|uniref:hypothetical protein n=1 Tax=Cellulophaga baltica TaxID=76594 RepID=UPI0024957B0B|nr:hypothetical protein [Cellulophaga baltica]